MADLPAHYFRLRENGALVFRVETQSRDRRLNLEQIATLSLRNGEVKPQGDRVLTEADRAAITGWLAERQALLAQREADEIQRTIEQMNLAAQWAQVRASDAQLDAVTDALLLAMHDLRSVLVRRKAERLMAGAAEGYGRQDV